MLFKRIHKKLLILSLVSSCFFTCLMSHLFIKQAYYRVSFNSIQVKDIEYQVFYTEKPGEEFSEDKSLKKVVVAGKHSVNIDIPVNKIEKFRLDFGYKPKDVLIYNLRLCGSKSLIFDFENDFQYSNINVQEAKDNRAKLFSKSNDPLLIYNKNINFNSKIYLDGFLLVITLIFNFCISYKFFAYIFKFKVLEHHSCLDIVFLCTFFIFLLVPISKIDNLEKSTQENRMLTKYTPLVANGKELNLQYGKDFEKWFNDHFRKRKLFIKIYNNVINYVNGKNENDKVFEGKDNWLFYKGDNGIENYKNATLFSQTELNKISEYLTAINKWCKKNNKKFYFIIAPDKNKIYGEYYKYVKKIRPDSKSRTKQLISYLKRTNNINIIYLHDQMMNNKHKGLLYYKNDTHWNDFGAYWGYLYIMEQISKDFKNISIYTTSDYEYVKNKKGDLTKMFIISRQKEDLTMYKKPKVIDNSICTSPSNLNIYECQNSYNKFDITIFHDSFYVALSRYFAQSFKHMHVSWRFVPSIEDVKFLKKSDVIILEMVERNIPLLSAYTFPEIN